MGKNTIDMGSRGKYDKRNKLNSLTGKEWLSQATTVWWSSNNESLEPEAAIYHKLIRLFSKDDARVLLLSTNGLDMNDIDQDIILAKNHAEGTTYDYAVCDYFLNFADLDEYDISSFCASLSDIINYKKYVSFFVRDHIQNGIPIQSAINYEMEKNGFIFRGKVNLGFNMGKLINIHNNEVLNQHIYILHYKNNKEDGASKETQPNIISYPNQMGSPKPVKLSNIRTSIWRSTTKLDKIGKIHPAPFSYLDIEDLLKLFTNEGDHVIDPFVGVSSTLLACGRTKRKGTGIDLNSEYINLSKNRLREHLFDEADFKLIEGDSLKIVPKLKDTFDYCVTSPPYHNILRNQGNGIRSDNSQFRQGVVYYSEEENDIGNQANLNDYLELFTNIMEKVKEKLNSGAITSIVISDFTVNKKETNITAMIVDSFNEIGFEYCGTIVLNQDQKAIYPFGYPYDYVINHTNQYVINFKGDSSE